MARQRSYFRLGDEGSRLLQGKEQKIFPWPVQSRVTRLLWVAVAIVCSALAVVIIAGIKAVG